MCKKKFSLFSFLCVVVFSLNFVSLISCENFLQGKGLRETLEEKIQYENSSLTKVQVDIETNSGTISSNLDYNLKPTDQINLNFKENNGYKFVYWKITDASGIVLENVVHIDDLFSINTTFELLKEYSGIVKIHPVCFFKSVIPEISTAGVPENSSIIITFNHPFDPATFSYFISNDNILHQENYNDYYFAPEFLNENCQIVIKKNPLMKFGLKNNEKKQIKITVSKDLKFLDPNITLSEDLENLFIVNSGTDTIPPVITNLSAKKVDSKNSICSENYFMGTFEEALNHYGEEVFFSGENNEEPRHVNKVQFDFSAYDSESGISKIIVKEKVLYNIDGDDVSKLSDSIQTEFLLNEFSYDDSVQTNSFVYDFTKINGMDGIVELRFIPVDYCGNYETDESKQPVFAMVRDTYMPYLITAGSDYFINRSEEDMTNFYIRGNEVFKYFSFDYFAKDPDVWASYNGKVYSQSFNFETAECYCGKKLDSLTKVQAVEIYENLESAEPMIHALYNRENYSRTEDYYFKLVAEDHAGNKKEFVFHEPALNVAYFELLEDPDNCFIYDLHIHMPIIPGLVYNSSVYYTTEYDIDSRCQTDSYFDFAYQLNEEYIDNSTMTACIHDIQNTNYYIYTSGTLEGENDEFYYDYPFLRTVINPYDLFENKYFIPPEISSENSFESMGANSGKYLLTVYLTEEDLEKYDSVILELESKSGETKKMETFVLTELKNEIQISTLRQSEFKYWLIGTKDNLSGKSRIVDLGKTEINNFSYPQGKYFDTFGNSIICYKPDISNFELDENGNYKGRCYYALTGNYKITSLDQLSYFDLEFNKDDDVLRIPVEKFYSRKGQFIPFLFFEDKYHNNNGMDIINGQVNWNFNTFNFAEYTEKVSLVDVLDDDILFSFESDNENPHFAIKYFDGTEWKYPKAASYFGWKNGYPINEDAYRGYLSDDSCSANFSIKNLVDKKSFSFYVYYDNESDGKKFRENIENKFVKVAYVSYDKKFALDACYSAPSYYYVSKDRKCLLKKLGDSTSIVTVHNDKPVLVQLVYGIENFGMNPDKWERWCLDTHKVNVVIYEPSVDENGISTPHYYYVDNSDVPFGSYYTVIAHYADGTSKMTTPVKK